MYSKPIEYMDSTGMTHTLDMDQAW